MGKYIIEYTENAIKDLRKHKQSGNKVTAKQNQNHSIRTGKSSV